MPNHIEDLITEDNCTGCSACLNACPQDAVRMVENHEGFIMPCVNAASCIKCGKCVAVCPVLNNFDNGNAKLPSAFAFQAPDAIRAESSSGGMFTVLASIILSKGGVVCGAIFDKEFGVHHAIAQNIAEMAPMRSSKYVQSYPHLIYREIKSLLEQDKYVLFSGTPCQIAGLRAFLDKSYERLLCVDIICHGVPPQGLLKKHLSEIAHGRKIKQVNFRDKRFGWTSLKLNIEFNDGNSYEGDNMSDAYEKGFHPNLFLRRTCADCKFCEFPRQGDLTMGDFWGVEQIMPEFADGKGCSLIYVNNEKGESFVEVINRLHMNIKTFDLEPNRLKNRTTAKCAPHPMRVRFFRLNKSNSLGEAVNKSLADTYDVGCVGIYSVPNFGGAMTYYALYKVLEDMGYRTLMIERPNSAEHKPSSIETIYEKEVYPSNALAKIYEDKNAMFELNDICDTFIVGSDQLFNDYLYNSYDRFVNLDWVRDNKHKISYAASFGHEHIWSNEDTRAELSYYMQKYDYFSTREDSGVSICNEKFGVNATHVLDPVFLCDKKHYEDFSASSNDSNNDEYIFSYILDPNDDKQKIITNMSLCNNLNYILYGEFGNDNDFYLKVTREKFNQQLYDIIHSNFIITDSFHGVCFALIFHKNFICFANNKRGYTRFVSLLSPLNLLNRIVSTFSEYESRHHEFSAPIDYLMVDKKLNELKNKSYEWLSNALANRKLKSLSDLDITRKMMFAMKSTLTKELDKKYKIIKRLAYMQDNKFILIENIYDYLIEMILHLNEIIIIISVKDTPGFFLNARISSLLSMLGLRHKIIDCHWHSYVAVIDCGKTMYETLSEMYETIEYACEIDELSIKVG